MAKKQKKNKKWLHWGMFLVLFVVVAAVVYLTCSTLLNNGISSESQGSSEQEEIIDNENEVEVEVEKQKDIEVTEKPAVEQYDGEDPNTMNELSGVITYTGVAGGNLIIRMNIDQYLAQDGSCELSIRKDGNVVYSDVATVVDNAATSTCEGFDVPVRTLGSGDFEIVINVNGNGKNGVIYGKANI